MSNQTIKAIYLADIKKIQVNIAKREALLASGNFTDLNKYPEYMQRELTEKYIVVDEMSISELNKLILEL